MMQHLVIYPIIFQLFLAVALMFLWSRLKWQRWFSILGSGANLIVAIVLFINVWQNGIQIAQAGNWSAPFGITFVADTFAVVLVLLTSISGLAVSVFATGSMHPSRMKFGFYPILHFLLMGLNGAFLTGDLFNLYVWFEIIIISSFVLLTLGGEKNQLEGAVKYFTLNMLASVVFLTAIGVLYGLAGTLNMADLAQHVAVIENRGLVAVCALFFMVGFGIKSAVFPLYFWLPASYHTPPDAVSAIFGGLLTKVGVYALIRVFTLIFPGDEFINTTLYVMAILTLLSGGMGALIQNNLRKVFSYLIICHIGFMLAGLSMHSHLALTGALFYMVHDIMVKTNLFMTGGLIYKLSGTNSLRKMGGLYDKHPYLSLLMVVPLFSLVGVPPLSGFWPKFSLIKGAFSGEHWAMVFALIVGSFLTLFVVAKIWLEVFWKNKPDDECKLHFVFFDKLKKQQKTMYVLPIVFLSLISLYIGFGAEHIQVLVERIANELLNNQNYIESVLKHNNGV